MVLRPVARALAPKRKKKKKLGRDYFQDRKGKFTSRKVWERIQIENKKEAWLINELGAPKAGQTWTYLVEKYPERFEDYISGLSEAMRRGR